MTLVDWTWKEWPEWPEWRVIGTAHVTMFSGRPYRVVPKTINGSRFAFVLRGEDKHWWDDPVITLPIPDVDVVTIKDLMDNFETYMVLGVI